MAVTIAHISGCSAVKVSQESRDLPLVSRKDLAAVDLLSNSPPSYNVAEMPTDARSVQEALRVLEKLSSSQMRCMLYSQPETPIQDWIRLIAQIHAVITELKQKLEAIAAEKDKVKKASARALDQYETDMVARNAEIKRLKDEIKQCVSSLEESAQEESEKNEAEMKCLQKELETEEQRLEQSELEVLGHMKTVLNLRIEEEKSRCLLAEANLSMSKVENDLRKIERDAAKTEYTSVKAQREKWDLSSVTDLTKQFNSFNSPPSNPPLSEPCH